MPETGEPSPATAGPYSGPDLLSDNRGDFMEPTDRRAGIADLRSSGWCYVRGVSSQSDLLGLARSIGRPIPSPTGELIKELRPTAAPRARPGTLSFAFGAGSFPGHTDTAFWPVPARYLVFRVRGDYRRRTTVMRLEDVIRKGPSNLTTNIERAVWVVRTNNRRFYCSMKFRHEGNTGWRYDVQCMAPANAVAVEVRELLGPLLTASQPVAIDWGPDLAVVVSNWEILHGRGPAPPDETDRILERVYVE